MRRAGPGPRLHARPPHRRPPVRPTCIIHYYYIYIINNYIINNATRCPPSAPSPSNAPPARTTARVPQELYTHCINFSHYMDYARIIWIVHAMYGLRMRCIDDALQCMYYTCDVWFTQALHGLCMHCIDDALQ